MKISYLLCLISLIISACTLPSPYHSAPRQNLSLTPTNNSVIITVLNNTGSNVEFYRGTLKGLILAPWESYQTRLSLGYQSLSWRQVVLDNNRIYSYSDRIIVTHRSKNLRIIPPPDDNMFYTRGRGCLQLTDY